MLQIKYLLFTIITHFENQCIDGETSQQCNINLAFLSGIVGTEKMHCLCGAQDTNFGVTTICKLTLTYRRALYFRSSDHADDYDRGYHVLYVDSQFVDLK